jgi:hypothetical protein
MQFKAANPPSFDAMNDPSQGDSQVEVAKETKVGQPLAFTLKGNGIITEPPAETASNAAQQQDQSRPDQAQPGQSQTGGSRSSDNRSSENRPADNRPGGGLGVPIDAPDALQQYRWPILGGFALLLALGGWVATRRQAGPSAAATAAGSAVKPGATSIDSPSPRSAPATTPAATAAAPPTRSSMLLEALKEELFQLEVERKTGKITPEEYEKAKAALDQTLDRALKRQQA